jgi:hypothetical protein
LSPTVVLLYPAHGGRSSRHGPDCILLVTFHHTFLILYPWTSHNVGTQSGEMLSSWLHNLTLGRNRPRHEDCLHSWPLKCRNWRDLATMLTNCQLSQSAGVQSDIIAIILDLKRYFERHDLDLRASCKRRRASCKRRKLKVPKLGSSNVNLVALRLFSPTPLYLCHLRLPPLGARTHTHTSLI